jgi:uncharacterized protein (DUF169 family)
MDQELIKDTERFSVVLGLERRIIGIRFLLIQQEYDASDAAPIEFRMTYCRMLYNAMKGRKIKATKSDFTCQGGPEMLGLRPLTNYEQAGKQFDTFRLYEDMAVAHAAQHDLLPIDHISYGVEIGSIEQMERADVVIIVSDAYQAMRIIQGYTYHYGMASHIGTIGNQGACSDLTARPYMTNDINLSLLCAGARQSMNTTDGEVGIGMPMHIFRTVVRSVLATVNAAQNDLRKKEIQKRAEASGIDLGFELDYGHMYGNYPERYPVEEYK